MALSIVEYKDFVMDRAERARAIHVGHFYTFHYRFYTHYPPEELKYYDYFPLVFIFERRKTKEGKIVYYGLNFHHMPVRSRQIWLARINKIYGNSLENGDRITRFGYRDLFALFKKSIGSIRQYRQEGILNLYRIPTPELRDIMTQATDTYYGVTLAEVRTKYQAFIPPRQLP